MLNVKLSGPAATDEPTKGPDTTFIFPAKDVSDKQKISNNFIINSFLNFKLILTTKDIFRIKFFKIIIKFNNLIFNRFLKSSLN